MSHVDNNGKNQAGAGDASGKGRDPHSTDMNKDRETQAERNEENLLDQAVEDTFPASDPLSVTRAPKEKRETQLPPDSAAEHDKPNGR